MLKLPRHDRFTVQVGNLFNFQGALESRGELTPSAQQEEALLALEELGAHFLDGIVDLQDLADLIGHLGQAFHNLLPPLPFGGTVLAEGKGKHDHGNELRGVCLGRCNTDLRASIDMDTAVRQKRNGRSDHVDDSHGQGAPFQTVSESQE